MNEIVMNMIRYFGKDVKRINHALKVYSFAEIITNSESLSQTEKEVVKISAILHDIGIKEAERKYNSTSGKYQEIEGPLIARQILKKNKILDNIIERACYIIGNHHSYQKIDGTDFQIIIEADFIVNIYEDSLNDDSIKSIYDKYFRTKKGKELIKTLYLNL